MNYRERLDKATKRAFNNALRTGKPVSWRTARELGRSWCALHMVFPRPPKATGSSTAELVARLAQDKAATDAIRGKASPMDYAQALALLEAGTDNAESAPQE